MLQTFYRNEGGNLTKTSLARNTNYLRHFLPPPFFFFFFYFFLYAFLHPSPSLLFSPFFFKCTGITIFNVACFDKLIDRVSRKRISRIIYSRSTVNTALKRKFFIIGAEFQDRIIGSIVLTIIGYFIFLFFFFDHVKLCKNILIPLSNFL